MKATFKNIETFNVFSIEYFLLFIVLQLSTDYHSSALSLFVSNYKVLGNSMPGISNAPLG